MLGFLILVVTGPMEFAGMRDPVMELAVVAAVVLFWAPAFAFIPAAILGWFVEQPKARRMIARRSGGLAPHLAISIVAALLLWLLFRTGLFITASTPQLMDGPSLALFALVGLCSGVSWWFMVVEPGRRK
ncbi:MAG TPA: hypothetical protein VFU20_01100 [Sphingomicrobium sp.]|nr:hypothetical protein [Sphingomicrobium sp.]